MAGLAAAVAGLDAGALERFLVPQRWFDGKGRRTRSARLRDLVPLDAADRLGVARVEAAFDDGGDSTYQVPLALVGSDERVPERAVVGSDPDGAIADAIFVAAFRRLLGRAVGEGACFRAGDVRWRVRPRDGQGTTVPVGDGRPMGVEQSNGSLVYDDVVVVKLVGKLERGINPDVEIGEFLARYTTFRHVLALLATVVFEDVGGENTVAGMAQRFVPSLGDGWSWALARLGAWLERSGDASDDFPDAAAALGRITRGLHQALASRPDVEAFSPEPVTAEQARHWAAAVAAGVARAIDRLADARRGLQPPLAGAAGAGAASAPARGRTWTARARGAFLDGYLDEAAGAGAAILPRGRDAAMRAVAFLELAYELGNRPGWVRVPHEGALRLLDGLEKLG